MNIMVVSLSSIVDYPQSLNILIILLQFFNGHNVPIIYPEKEVAGGSETATEVSDNLEINTEPILPSEHALNNVKDSLIDTEISKSDPCVTGNVSEDLTTEAFDRLSIVDGFNTTHENNGSDVSREVQTSDIAHENSAFTKVIPDKQPSATSVVDKILKTEDTPLLMPAPEEPYIPDLVCLDEDTSDMENTTFSTEDNTENFGPELKGEILNNSDTINVPPQDHSQDSTSPVSGNIPPHNTPVIGANKGEINLQDVRLALTQVFNDENADGQHVDNGHDYRRSVSADVFHEKEKEQGMRLRHNSGI